MTRPVKFAAPNLLQARLQLWRSRFIFGLVAFAFVALGVKALYLQTASKPFLQEQGARRYERTIELEANRGRIMDRHGAVLASSLPARSVWAYPAQIDPSDPRLMDLARLLDIKPLDLHKRLTGEDRHLIQLKRRVDLETADRIRALQIKAITQENVYQRDYPQGEAFAHLVGFTDIDHIGQEGLELSFESLLAGQPGSRRVMRDGNGRIIGGIDLVREPRDGRDLRLTIDERIQGKTFAALKATVREQRARAGAAVVLDARNGEILALANWPSYNPNDRSKLSGSQLRNRAITDLYEPGSTLKPFTAALGLESGKYRPQSLFDVREGKLKIGPDTIRDSHRARELLTLEQVIQKSSNLGTARIALSLPPEDHWRLLNASGFGQSPKIGFPGAASGRLKAAKAWKPIEQATISYGHGVSVSLLQMARAYTIFAGDGELLQPKLIRSEDELRGGRPVQVSARARGPEPGPTVRGVPVIRPETAAAIRKMLEMAAGPKGTAPQAQVPGFRVGGKTGTTTKIERGRYVKKYVSSFVGMAPMSNPRIIVAVMIDEPSAGKFYGGDIAGPLFATIAGHTLSTLAIAPDAPFETMITPVAAKAEPSASRSEAAARSAARTARPARGGV
ncbi:MAG: peptidoglycan D,D-transpeptidase FtsI family protein [Lautropia sp.]